MGSHPSYQLQIQLYQFPLSPPLLTAHGYWEHRQGIIVTLVNHQGRIGQGEIAPLPWFGTEDLATAQRFCQQWQGKITDADIEAITDNLPCCQFAFGAAWGDLRAESVNPPENPLQFCQLLPTGVAVFDHLNNRKKLNCGTVKWKIGVQDFAQEWPLYQRLIHQLPPGTRIRLDANGGLTMGSAQQWLRQLDQQGVNFPPITVDYLEQPLPPAQIKDIFRLSQNFQTPLALDEAVASLGQLQQLYDQGWSGIYVLKAAIMGHPQRLQQWLTQHPIRGIFSSVFETNVGRQQVLTLAQRWNLANYAVGFAPNHC